MHSQIEYQQLLNKYASTNLELNLEGVMKLQKNSTQKAQKRRFLRLRKSSKIRQIMFRADLGKYCTADVFLIN